ncbi:hypothetical protein N8T08_010510 [Aspergillus melleus]|uniref:Uncharacterized protein n=1 Tax=Aspergillus melleus TaxID=138277 RepID=A0ACC3ASL9_9EURO|nr:hypothetical protein N8T08_010510 [Aspergillus melleus]
MSTPSMGLERRKQLATDVAFCLDEANVSNLLFGWLAHSANRALLEQSTVAKKPVFAIMGSGAGFLGRQHPVPSAVYGGSKSMVHWYGVQINAEEEWLNTFVIKPGWAKIDMGNSAAQLWGLEEPPDPVEGPDGCFRILNGAKTLYNDLPEAKAELWEWRLIPQSYAVQMTAVTRAAYIPSTYLM